MLKQNSRTFRLIVITLLLCSAPAAFSQSPTPTPTPREARKTFKLQIEVTAGDPPDRIDRAAVLVRSEEGSARFTKETKMNKQGVANVSQVPQGKLVIQVVAKRCDTFGNEYTLTEDNQTIKITLKKWRTP
jgi:hypothetical protein